MGPVRGKDRVVKRQTSFRRQGEVAIHGVLLTGEIFQKPSWGGGCRGCKRRLGPSEDSFVPVTQPFAAMCLWFEHGEVLGQLVCWAEEVRWSCLSICQAVCHQYACMGKLEAQLLSLGYWGAGL